MEISLVSVTAHTHHLCDSSRVSGGEIVNLMCLFCCTAPQTQTQDCVQPRLPAEPALITPCLSPDTASSVSFHTTLTS